MAISATNTVHELAIEIGQMPIVIRTDSGEFAGLLKDRYGAFVSVDTKAPVFTIDIELVSPGVVSAVEDVCVRVDSRRWVIERGDFRAELDPVCRQGRVRQSANPYSIDSVLRVLHSLILARNAGFLIHAASAVRNGRAFLFAGVSGAGKTTLSRLAPSDVTLLTDEISYVRRQESGYAAFGTPFAGELARIGENLLAPVGTLYLLAQGPENRIEHVGESEAVRSLLQNILFFGEDTELVTLVFKSVLDFVGAIPVRRLVFAPDARVWELIT